MTLPEIPASWSQALAATGAIIVVLLLLRWTANVLDHQGKQSELLITRSFDIADKIVSAGVKLRADESGADIPPEADEPATETPLLE